MIDQLADVPGHAGGRRGQVTGPHLRQYRQGALQGLVQRTIPRFNPPIGDLSPFRKTPRERQRNRSLPGTHVTRPIVNHVIIQPAAIPGKAPRTHRPGPPPRQPGRQVRRAAAEIHDVKACYVAQDVKLGFGDIEDAQLMSSAAQERRACSSVYSALMRVHRSLLAAVAPSAASAAPGSAIRHPARPAVLDRRHELIGLRISPAVTCMPPFVTERPGHAHRDCTDVDSIRAGACDHASYLSPRS